MEPWPQPDPVRSGFVSGHQQDPFSGDQRAEFKPCSCSCVPWEVSSRTGHISRLGKYPHLPWTLTGVKPCSWPEITPLSMGLSQSSTNFAGSQLHSLQSQNVDDHSERFYLSWFNLSREHRTGQWKSLFKLANDHVNIHATECSFQHNVYLNISNDTSQEESKRLLHFDFSKYSPISIRVTSASWS